MNPQEQRITIAETCRWPSVREEVLRALSEKERKLGLKISGGAMDYCGVPDYLNDLNAMESAYEYLVSISNHFAAKRQPDVMFNLILMEIMNPDKKLWDNGTFLGSVFDGLKTANATAKQRAEAFLRTLNLWRE